LYGIRSASRLPAEQSISEVIVWATLRFACPKNKIGAPKEMPIED
jgi:hypothetical protein